MTNGYPEWVQEASRLPVGFAQVREDAALDLRVLSRLGAARAHVAMVASGGCTAAALAADPRVASLHLVDPNPSQLALARLKLRLLERAAPEERLAVLGHLPMREDRRGQAVVGHLRGLGLSHRAVGPVASWAGCGPDHSGRYELLWEALRRELAPWGGQLAGVMSLRDPGSRGRLAAASTPLGAAIDEAFVRVMSLPHLVKIFGPLATSNRRRPFSGHFADRTRAAFSRPGAESNPYLAQVLLGSFSDGAVLPWLTVPSPERMPAVTWSAVGMAQALRETRRKADLVHLSNILDWLSPLAAAQVLDRAWDALRPGGFVIVRQLNSRLEIPALERRFDWLGDLSRDLTAADRSFLYRAVLVGRKN